MKQKLRLFIQIWKYQEVLLRVYTRYRLFMKRGNIILAILISIGFVACNSKAKDLENEYWKVTIETQRLSDFFSFIANFPNSEKRNVCIAYIDSLVKLDPTISFSCGYCFDSVQNRLLLSFTDIAEFDYLLKKRNAFVLTVTDTGLFHNNKLISNENFYESMKNYHTNHWSHEEFYPQNKLTDNKYFGTITVSKICPVIETEREIIEPHDSINWNLYLETIQMVKDTYLKIWNEKANLVWGKDFYELKFEKQEAIIKTARIGMELNFVKRTFYQGEQ